MKLLTIETACPPGSTALLDGDRTIAFRSLSSAQRTTETFAVDIRESLREVRWSARDVEVVATTIGPGSFTGLRIGVTAAKVFAWATGARVLGVNTLELIASQAPGDGDVEAVLDAQRSELFVGRYRKSGEDVVEIAPTRIISIDEWIDRLEPEVTLTGPGLRRIRDRLDGNVRLASEERWLPTAKTLGRLAASRAAAGAGLIGPMELVPQYFRKSAAEEKAERKAR